MKSQKKPQRPKDKVKRQLGSVRQKMKADGVYDGRYKTKIFNSQKKKKPKYNKKHHIDDAPELIQELL